MMWSVAEGEEHVARLHVGLLVSLTMNNDPWSVRTEVFLCPEPGS